MSHPGRLYFAVALGATIGSVARALASTGAAHLFGPGFPWGTLAVNVSGSFVIGLYATLTDPDGRLLASPTTRQFVMAGFCGGFTTFSIFSLETLLLLEQGRPGLAGLNAGLSLPCWLLAVWGGHRIGVRINRLKSTLR